MLQWGRDVSIPEIWARDTACRARTWLQWGRDVSIPEITLASPGGFAVTMLQWGRDVSIPEIRASTPAGGASTRFNGAGMFLSRKFSEFSSTIFDGPASMGPGCFYPGNNKARVLEVPTRPLQWGRDVSIPEMINWKRIQQLTGLLQWGRDVSIPEIDPPRPYCTPA